MAHPRRQTTSELKLFNTDLFPDLKGDLPFEWIVRNFTVTYDSQYSRVESLVREFVTDFVSYINRCQDENIPEAIKACKRRSADFINFCQTLIGLNEQNYQLVPLTEDVQLIKSNYKVRFTKKMAAISEIEEDSFIMDVNITSNPRCYRRLYDAAILTCYLPIKEDRSLIWVLIQTVGELYKSVKMTDKEILNVEKEFLDAAEDEQDTFSGSEAEQLLSMMKKDMKSSNPPLYCRDLAAARRSIDGFLHNHSYGIEDASYSTASSGSKLTINGVNIPNIALIFSAIERDAPMSVDGTLKYKSFYPEADFPGLEPVESLSQHVPKTSSRGERWIHSNRNGRQDRGNIIETCMKHVLSNVIKSDSTFDQPQGVRKMYTKILADVNKELIIAGTDMKAATDWLDHKALHSIWEIFFREDIPDFLLWLHSGEGLIKLHDPSTMEEITRTYCQKRGIKCGTRSNFSVGLALIHHVVMRLTMLKLGLQDYDPEDIYEVLGDDNNHFLKSVNFLPVHKEGLQDWEYWLETYTQIAYSVGFRVHPISEKGTLSIAGSDSLTKGEFAKQTWSQYGMVSGIPYRLFWSSLRKKDNLLPIILWLSQYQIVIMDITRLTRVAQFFNPERPEIFMDVWDFACKQGLYGLTTKMMFNETSQCGYSDRQIAIQFFEEFLEGNLMDTIFNNRSRLSKRAIESKIKRFSILVEDSTLIDRDNKRAISDIHRDIQRIHEVTGGRSVIDYIIDWNHSVNAPMSKLEYSLQKNQKFADSLRDVWSNPFIPLSAELGVFSEEDINIIKAALPYVRFNNLEIPGEDPVDILMKARFILKDKQPISISKRINRSSKFLSKVIDKLWNEIPYTQIG